MPWADDIEGTADAFNVRHEWQSFDGNMPHCTLPFTGTRYTLIYHTNRSHYRMDGESWRFLEKEMGFPMPPRDFHKPPYPKQLSRLSAGMHAFAKWREGNEEEVAGMKVGVLPPTKTDTGNRDTVYTGFERARKSALNPTSGLNPVYELGGKVEDGRRRRDKW
jgi:hypothetical protein